MKQTYFDIIMMIERLHRLCLDVIKVELDRLRIHDINNVQCFILYNIGENELSIGEISNRGYYLGSNVTYNLKKMVENGYVEQLPSSHDKRSSHIKLSQKGLSLLEHVHKIMQGHTDNMKNNNIQEQDINAVKTLLQRLESFWNFIMVQGVRF